MKRPPVDEFKSLCEALVVREGVTTGAGAAAGTSIIDAGLIGFGVNSYVDLVILINPGQEDTTDAKICTVFANGTGEITVGSAFKGGQVLAGVPYKVLNLGSSASSIAAAMVIINNIFSIVNAMLELTETGGIVTTTGPGTEDDVYINNAPTGVFEPIAVKIDMTNNTAGETVVVRTYYRYFAGGGWIEEDVVAFAGVIAQPSITIDLDPCRFGIRVTIERTVGAARTYRWFVTKKD
jgi:hypothetical protein